METTGETLACGCVKEFVNNKWIWITCDEHETGDNLFVTEKYTKYRRSYDFEQ